MTREYTMPDGTPVPAELQDKIADDVRAFDAAQAPAARTAVQLRKMALDLPRIRGALADLIGAVGEATKIGERQAVALELQALYLMGFSSRQLRESVSGKLIAARYGLTEPDWDDERQL